MNYDRLKNIHQNILNVYCQSNLIPLEIHENVWEWDAKVNLND